MKDTTKRSRKRSTPRGDSMEGLLGGRNSADGIVPHDLAEGQPSFIERSGGCVRIGQHVLEVMDGGGTRVPSAPEAFTFDPPSARTLAFLTDASIKRRSVLLIGPTGTSKTACVRHFAYLTGRPLYMVNLSEQTQLEDFVGQVSPTENWWNWTDGAVTRAIREGGVLLLDEINLAPSSILARLHELHERRPALVLQERRGERVAAAEGFFLAATGNPAGYEGRQTLSPDLIDRFTGLETGHAGADAHVAFLRQCVFGEGPSIRVAGRIYRGERAEPIYPRLAELPGIEDLLGRLGRFHAEVEAAAVGTPQDGLDSWWTPVGPCFFSRRRLIRAIEDIDALVGSGTRPEEAAAAAVADRYLALLTPAASEVVRDIAAANGLDGQGG